MSVAFSKIFIYVSSAIDGDIGAYELTDNGVLKIGPRIPVAPAVMPLAVNQKAKLLYAAARSKPFTVFTYKIDPASGGLALFDEAPLADNFAYISLDRDGENLFAASYGSSLISVNSITPDGRVTHTPMQVIPVGRNAHSILVDASNQYVFVPTLGSDEVFQFHFDSKEGRLHSNTPSVYLADAGTGPRHFIFSHNNRFVYLLNELAGTITTFSLDLKTGLLKFEEIDSMLPEGSHLKNGALSDASLPTNQKIWAADIHLTPNGKFLYASERTNSTIAIFSVDEQSGKLTYVSSIETEKQPRGFAIDPSGRFLIATGELSEFIASYSINQMTGELKLVGRYPTGKGSSWVEIVSYPQQ